MTPLPAYTIDACKLREMGKNNPPPQPNTSRELSVETARTKIVHCETSDALSKTLVKTCAIFGDTRTADADAFEQKIHNERNPPPEQGITNQHPSQLTINEIVKLNQRND